MNPRPWTLSADRSLWSFTVSSSAAWSGWCSATCGLPLVVLLATSPAAGAGANVAISGVAALTSTAAHWRGGVNWRLFAWMAPPSLVRAIAGGLVSGVLPRPRPARRDRGRRPVRGRGADREQEATRAPAGIRC